MAVKSLKNRIRTPVLALILSVPLVTLLLFNIGVRIYANQSARQELQAVAKAMETEVKKELSGSLDTAAGSNKLDRSFEKFYRIMNSSKLATDTDMLLYGAGGKLLYPRQEESFPSGNLSSAVGRRLPSMADNRVYNVSAGGERCFVLCLHLSSSGNGATVVFLSQPRAVNALIRVMNLILLAIMTAGAALAVVIANRISQRVAEPVTELTALTEKIGGGDFAFPEGSGEAGGIAEINRLTRSIGEMADRLRKYDQTQKSFLQNASHELKTPLMSIQGYAEGIEKGIVPDVPRAAGIIRSESQRLNLLVEELLTLSRIENRTYGRELADMDLTHALREYVQRLGGYASKLDRKLTLSLPESPVPVFADDVLLSQAVMNVASNCLRYARAEVNLALTVRQNEAAVRISDDGPGIPQKDLPHIFERFYKGQGGNFGLGLSIAQSAVLAMGGRITVQNTEKGAAFDVVLPLRSVPAQEQGART